MKMRVGILTSGGDCPGLNATIRGVAKALYHRMGDKVEIIGIMNGYDGLIHGNYRMMDPSEFSGILTVGGTILGTKRTPFKMMRVVEDDKIDKVAAMKKTYKEAKLDCLLCLGGNGTHKTANLLSQEGLNIIGLPKTIDNDIYGTDVTFGFHTAVDIAAGAIKRIRTTAESHSRVFFVEVMGNKVGWLTLYSGIAAGADAILIPEIAYDEDKLAKFVTDKKAAGARSVVVAVAEGASSTREAAMSKKEKRDYLASCGGATVAERLAGVISQKTGMQCRATVLGHIQRGGEPCAYDKFISTEIGAFGAHLAKVGRYGVTVCIRNNKLGFNMLVDIAGKAKRVAADGQLVLLSKDMGIYFGD